MKKLGCARSFLGDSKSIWKLAYVCNRKTKHKISKNYKYLSGRQQMVDKGDNLIQV